MAVAPYARAPGGAARAIQLRPFRSAYERVLHILMPLRWLLIAGYAAAAGLIIWLAGQHVAWTSFRA